MGGSSARSGSICAHYRRSTLASNSRCLGPYIVPAIEPDTGGSRWKARIDLYVRRLAPTNDLNSRWRRASNRRNAVPNLGRLHDRCLDSKTSSSGRRREDSQHPVPTERFVLAREFAGAVAKLHGGSSRRSLNTEAGHAAAFCRPGLVEPRKGRSVDETGSERNIVDHYRVALCAATSDEEPAAADNLHDAQSFHGPLSSLPGGLGATSSRGTSRL